jgi:4-amino-4-deoxychorismate lyase
MILVNGVETGMIAAGDRGLAFGDGVFRTIRVRNSVPQQWLRQRAKLAADCTILGIRCPEARLLDGEVAQVSRKSGDCAVKIIVTRGATLRGYRYAEDLEPTRIVLSAPLPTYPASYGEAGVKVRLCRLKLAHQAALAGVKHLNRLENVLARAEWSDSDIAEGILCDVEEHAIGGTMTNIFVVRGGMLATPRLHRCGVAGVTRERVIDAAAKHGVACDVADLSWNDVVNADEVFLVNSLAGVWPVRDIAGQCRSPGALTRAAQRWLSEEDDAQVD